MPSLRRSMGRHGRHRTSSPTFMGLDFVSPFLAKNGSKGGYRYQLADQPGNTSRVACRHTGGRASTWIPLILKDSHHQMEVQRREKGFFLLMRALRSYSLNHFPTYPTALLTAVTCELLLGLAYLVTGSLYLRSVLLINWERTPDAGPDSGESLFRSGATALQTSAVESPLSSSLSL